MFAKRTSALLSAAVLLCAQPACGDSDSEASPDVVTSDAGLTPDAADSVDVEDAMAADAAPDDGAAIDTIDETEDTQREDAQHVDVQDGHTADSDAALTDTLQDVVDAATDVIDGELPSGDAEATGDGETDAIEVEPPRFSRVAAGALADHQVATTNVPANGFGYGYGIAPVDPDGDGDLDLFVGTLPLSAVPACIYENVSTPGNIAFERRDAWCAPLEWELQAAVGFDANFDGEHELVAVSETAAYLFRERIGWTERGMFDDFERCDAGPLAAIDQDWDGDLEIVIGCVPDVRGRSRFRQGAGVTLEVDLERGALTRADRDVFPLRENALGLGVADANQDGLLDLISVVDTFGSPTSFSPDIVPSALLRRCGPDRRCGSERVRFGDRALAWGSHMGLEVFTMPDGRDVYWLADRDEPRPVYYGDAFFTPAPFVMPPDLFADSDGYFDIWGIVAGAWDADANLDFFFAAGAAIPRELGPDLAYADGILTTSWRDGALLADVAVAATEQLEDPNVHRDPIHESVRASRAALQQDIDGDGRADLIVAASNGAPFVYVAEAGAEVCTIRPYPQTVMSWGAGYRLLRDTGIWAIGPVHGEVLSSDGPWLVTSEREGRLRFPSGAAVAYACGTDAVVDVVEPIWFTGALVAGALAVTIDESAWWAGPPARVEAWIESDIRDGAIYELSGTGGLWKTTPLDLDATTRAMLRVDGQWVARWIAL